VSASVSDTAITLDVASGITLGREAFSWYASPGGRRDRADSIFGNRSEQGTVVDRPAIAHQNVGQYTGD
jgi:hypothetical protein